MQADWTFMVYMAGANNLSSAAGTDLREMREVGSTDRVKVCCFVKQQDEAGAYHLMLGADGDGDRREELGDKDSGSPQTVLDFVRWADEVAPAERRALVLWNHGSGWAPQDFAEIYAQVRGEAPGDADARELSVRSNELIARSFFRTTIERFVELEPDERAICSDDGTGHSLDTIELGRVLARAREDAGRPFDLLGMDACLMSNLEVAYQARREAEVVVGSEELEPNAGWPYHTILADLTENPEMDGRTLGCAIVDRYIASYRDSDREWPVTQCAVAADEVAGFSRAVSELSEALREQLADDYRPVQQSQSRAVRFEMHLRDLKSFCDALRASPAGRRVHEAAEQVLAALEPGDYVLREGHLGGKVADCGGVTLYFPSPDQPVSPHYRDLRFARTHGWDEFLRAYASAVRGG